MASSMRSLARRVASTLMLAATIAFVLQSAMILGSQAMAQGGVMPHAAVALSGNLHLHDGLAKHVHAHGGNNAAGHAHPPGDHNHDETDGTASGLFLTLGGASGVVPALETNHVVPVVAGIIEAYLGQSLESFDPGRLSRPPSTPSIA